MLCIVRSCAVPYQLLSNHKEMNNSLGCFLISKINTLVLFILIDIAEDVWYPRVLIIASE